MRALDLLDALLDLGELERHEDAWREWAAEAQVEGWFDGLDEHDGVTVLTYAFEDLGGNADGSHFMRWRAEQIRAGIVEETLHDHEAVASALDAIAVSMSKAVPEEVL